MKMFLHTSHLVILLLLCTNNDVVSKTQFVEIFKILPEPEPVVTDYSYLLTVDVTTSHHNCHREFVSLTIDTYSIKKRWREFTFGSEKFQNLAAALSPTVVRVGGTYADFLIFDSNATENDLGELKLESFENDHFYNASDPEFPSHLDNFTMTGSQWTNLTQFLSKVGWDLFFDFNLFLTKDGHWDPSNAELLLNYSAEKGIAIPYFQLGNEPNSFPHNFNFSIPPDTLTRDFGILKDLISKYPLYNASRLYGPDVTNLNVKHHGLEYLSDFLSSGAYNYISGITLHHYYFSCWTATEEEFLNVSILESFKSELNLAVETLKKYTFPLPILFTETSSCFGGGADNLSDVYVSGFIWLDKLGLASKFFVSKVFRQTFLGGPYGLLNPSLNPYPDYYTTVLYKKLIEGPVFEANTVPAHQYLRVYATCASVKRYKAGALAIYYLNLQENKAVLDMPQFQDSDLHLYLLTPGDEKNLLSRNIKLNGELLKLHDSNLPPLPPKIHRGKVVVDAWSYGFIVLPDSNVFLCEKYFANSTKSN